MRAPGPAALCSSCTCSTMPPLSPKSTSKSNESGSITAFLALQTGVVARWNPGGGARHAATAIALLIATLIFLKSSRDARLNQEARCFGILDITASSATHNALARTPISAAPPCSAIQTTRRGTGTTQPRRTNIDAQALRPCSATTYSSACKAHATGNRPPRHLADRPRTAPCHLTAWRLNRTCIVSATLRGRGQGNAIRR